MALGEGCMYVRIYMNIYDLCGTMSLELPSLFYRCRS